MGTNKQPNAKPQAKYNKGTLGVSEELSDGKRIQLTGIKLYKLIVKRCKSKVNLLKGTYELNDLVNDVYLEVQGLELTEETLTKAIKKFTYKQNRDTVPRHSTKTYTAEEIEQNLRHLLKDGGVRYVEQFSIETTEILRDIFSRLDFDRLE